jgi:hypothetical protein
VVLASLALGVAFGTKWYGVVASPSVLLAWAAMTPHARWRPFLLASAGTALAGGFWVVRNAVLYGNPLYPLGLSVFGVPLLDGPPDLLRERLTQPILTYVFDLRVMLFEVIPDMGRWQALVGLTALIGLVAAVARLRRLTDRRVRWCVLAAVVVLVAYVVNPDGTIGVTGEPLGIGINSRYFLPSVILALVVLPAVAPRLASGRVAAPAVLCSVLIGCRALSTAQLAVLLGAGAWLVGVASWLLLSEPIGRNQQFVADPAVGWVYRHAPDGARIGIAGAWNTDRVISPTLALHGPRLRNRVTYVAAGTGLLDPYLERDDWVAAVKSGRFDLLFVGREPIPFVGDRAPGWAEQEFGQVRVAESDFFRLYDLRSG